MSLMRPTILHVAVVVHRGQVAGVHPAARSIASRRRAPRPPSSRASRSSRGCRARPSRRAAACAPVSGSTILISTCGCTRPTVADAVLEGVVGGPSASRPARSRSCRSRWSRRAMCIRSITSRITSTGHGEPAMIPVRSELRGRSRSKSRVIELGDEHGRHAVEGRAALLLHRLEHRARDRTRRPGRTTQAPCVVAAEVAHHHAEAVVERHRHADAVLARCSAQPLADEVAVVEDVVVRERRALGEAGGAATCTGC